jgi:glucosamine--fructose-6-phosphate aminotransferase (isomerizing)
MCGIVGAASRRDIVPMLLEGLRRLEYRGYDSAGVAVLLDGTTNPTLRRLRAAGRVAELAAQVEKQGLAAHTGISHTRWATHGAPTERNAHPHISGGLAVVHNGIIENHEAIRARLKAAGAVFVSDTDTEVIAHLVAHNRRSSAGLLEATVQAVAELEGAFAIALVCERDPDTVVLARKGAPLLIGLGEGENFAASDVSALVQVTRRVVYLEEGDCAELRPDRVRIVDARGAAVERPVHVSELTAQAVELGPYQHYMQKEIFEQPGAVAATLETVIGAQSLQPGLFGADAEALFKDVSSVQIVACGTSYHAGMVARYWLESIARIPTQVEIASEYRYRDSVPDPQGLFVTISQSGETADTLAALEHARSLGYRATLTICNVPESSLIRQSRLRFLTRAGPEIGVASTKAFTTQLAALFLLTLVLARLRGRLDHAAEAAHLQALRHLPAALQHVLSAEAQVAEWAKDFASKEHSLFLGRGIHYPIALEGALKLKEISYIHAEAYAAGELKHGPLALVDQHMPVIAVAPSDALLEKLKSNLQEVRARGGRLYVFADRDAQLGAEEEAVRIIKLTDHAGPLSPILHVLPLQLLAYHVALARGTDVDKPRNLAKSVTVE